VVRREFVDQSEVSDKVDLVAQGFCEAGFNTRFDTFSGGYDVMAPSDLGNFGPLRVESDDQGVKVIVGSSSISGQYAAVEAMRYAGVKERLE